MSADMKSMNNSRIRFDFNNMFSHAVGAKHGVTDSDLAAMSKRAKAAYGRLMAIMKDDKKRVDTGLEWTRLPFQSNAEVARIQRLAGDISKKYEAVISLGIGGSYLGLKACQDALSSAYYNDFQKARVKRPRIFFEGNNLDPDTLGVLLKNLDPKKTFVIAISKSGETTETKVAFSMVEKWLKAGVGMRYGRQVFVYTDPKAGALRSKVNAEQARDPESFRNLPVMKGVGGRFSELNIGILLMAIAGIDVKQVLDGAAAMHRRATFSGDLHNNAALMYACLHTIMYEKKGKPLAILMPFSEKLKSTADWYVQLLAESLGKKYDRSGRVVNVGRTPISARGTNDLHSIQQNNIEGENNKVITFIRIGAFALDVKVAGSGDLLEGRSFGELMALAEEATEWALVRQSRPSCTVLMPEISAHVWGQLIFFFEMATAFEGELLDVNAYDQPGVEGYKNYMYYRLGKKGLPAEVADEIRKSPLKKSGRYIMG
jgi:glucose-6-phosphate isomerase